MKRTSITGATHKGVLGKKNPSFFDTRIFPNQCLLSQWVIPKPKNREREKKKTIYVKLTNRYNE